MMVKRHCSIALWLNFFGLIFSTTPKISIAGNRSPPSKLWNKYYRTAPAGTKYYFRQKS
jgi:hypothetical protein